MDVLLAKTQKISNAPSSFFSCKVYLGGYSSWFLRLELVNVLPLPINCPSPRAKVGYQVEEVGGAVGRQSVRGVTCKGSEGNEGNQNSQNKQNNESSASASREYGDCTWVAARC